MFEYVIVRDLPIDLRAIACFAPPGHLHLL